MKKNIFIFAISIATLVVGVVLVEQRAETPSGVQVNVVASFYPLAHFAEKVGGVWVSVYNLTPAGAEPHDFEPTPRDIVALRNAKLILLNGAGFEPWFASVWKSGVIRAPILTLAEQVDLLPTPMENNDPHIWLDPIRAQIEVDAIRDALIAVDPRGREIYETNAAAYHQELVALADDYQNGLRSCRIRTIIAPHNAFQYLGKRYMIDVVSIAGISPDEEPSPKRMAELAAIARKNGVKKIFFETLVSPKLAETIAKEAGIEIGVLNPIEGLTEEGVAAGENYISLMKRNLEQLRKAMECL